MICVRPPDNSAMVRARVHAAFPNLPFPSARARHRGSTVRHSGLAVSTPTYKMNSKASLLIARLDSIASWIARAQEVAKNRF